jgi:hypothetical protein
MKTLAYFPLALPGYLTFGTRIVGVTQGTDSLKVSIYVPGRAEEDFPEVVFQWTDQGTDIFVSNGCEEIGSHHIPDKS